MENRIRHYDIAGITIRVESDLPFTDATFHRKFASFRTGTPGADTVAIRHHFGLPQPVPGMEGLPQPELVYNKPPWAIYRAGLGWVYLGVSPNAADPSLHRVAVFSADHSDGDIYHPSAYRDLWPNGEWTSLTLFPSDQVLVARLLAERRACILHSGGLTVDGQGFLFAGHSEAGKSTTMNLVRARLGTKVEILCDDRNVVRHWPAGFNGGPRGFYVHGTWSHGDVKHVSPGAGPLRAVLFLEQSARNELVPLVDRKRIWQGLLGTLIKPLVTADWWHKEMDVLEELAANVPCFIMRFDKSGAIVDELERLVQ